MPAQTLAHPIKAETPGPIHLQTGPHPIRPNLNIRPVPLNVAPTPAVRKRERYRDARNRVEKRIKTIQLECSRKRFPLFEALSNALIVSPHNGLNSGREAKQ
ncbi:MAG TPA: hypothetical protein DIV79_14580 [Opitutae bacterium]|nr:hypothetical protein [Opitutaceae bacterium]HCR31233.1 hypothetical protein [Opitutae bacterium]